MGIFSKFKRRALRREDGSSQVYSPRTGSPVPASFPDAGMGLNVSPVYRCVNFLADSVANLPFRYQRMRDGVFVDDAAGRLNYLLGVQPDACYGASDFWRQLVRCLLLKGNAYIVPVYDPALMDYGRLALVNPDCVSHDVFTDRYEVHDLVAGVNGTFAEEDILHVKNYSLDGKRGISTIAFARLAIGTAYAGDRETLNRFENGGNVRGLVSNDSSVRGFGEYQDSELSKTAVDLDAKFSSGQKIVSLPGQVQFSPISLSSTDMQFLETRKFGVKDICRFFGVHPSFVFEDSSSNYKSAENANVAFLSSGLNPILTKIEDEFQRKLVPESLAFKRRFIFDRRGIYSTDLASKVAYQIKTIQAGIYSVNDWRRAENLPEVEGGDRVLVSANLKPLQDVSEDSMQANQGENANENDKMQTKNANENDKDERR